MDEEQGIFDIYLKTVELKSLSTLLMGLDGMSVSLATDEIHALGFILNDMAKDMADIIREISSAVVGEI